MVGLEARRRAVARIHAVVRVLAPHGSRGKAVADLHALHRIDAHQGRCEVAVQLAVDWLPQTGGNAIGHHFDHRAQGRAVLAGFVQRFRPARRRCRVRREERVLAHLTPVPGIALNRIAAHRHQRAPHLALGAEHRGQHRPRHCARRDPHGGLPRRGAPAAAIVPAAIFCLIGIVGVAGAVAVHDLPIIAGALVLVLDHHADGGAGGHALEHAGEHLDPVRLLALGGIARLARTAAVELRLDCRFVDGNACWHAIHHTADGGPVALAPGGEAEGVAEGIMAHERLWPGLAPVSLFL